MPLNCTLENGKLYNVCFIFNYGKILSYFYHNRKSIKKNSEFQEGCSRAVTKYRALLSTGFCVMPALMRGQKPSSLGGMPRSGDQECYGVAEDLLKMPRIQDLLGAQQEW